MENSRSSLLTDGYMSNLRRKCRIFEIFYQKEVSKRFTLLLICAVGILTCLTIIFSLFTNLSQFSLWKCLLVSTCWGILNCLLIHCYRKIFLNKNSLLPSLLLFIPYTFASDLLFVWNCGNGTKSLLPFLLQLGNYRFERESYFLLVVIHSIFFSIGFITIGKLNQRFQFKLPLTNIKIQFKMIVKRVKDILLDSIIFSFIFSIVFCFLYSFTERIIHSLLESTLSSLFVVTDNFWSNWVQNIINLSAGFRSFLLTLFCILTWSFVQFLFDITVFVDPSFNGKQLELSYATSCLEISTSSLFRILALLEIRSLLYKDAAKKPSSYTQKYRNDLQELFASLNQFIDQLSGHFEELLQVMHHAKSTEQFVDFESNSFGNSLHRSASIPECLRIPITKPTRKLTLSPISPTKLKPIIGSTCKWNVGLFKQHDFVVLSLQILLAFLGIYRMEDEMEMEKQSFQELRDKLTRLLSMFESVHQLPTIKFGLGIPYLRVYGEECIGLLRQCISTLTIGKF